MLSQTLRTISRCSAVNLRRTVIQKYSIHRTRPTLLSRHTISQCRTYATPPPQLNESHLSMEEYHTLADEAMDQLLATMEDLLEEKGNADQEVDYHSGVLTLNLGKDGIYVINKQPPNKQIWLSSPISGPKRYDFQEDTRAWVYSRDRTTLDGLLSEELSKIFADTIKFSFKP